MKSTPTPRAKRREWNDPAEIALLKRMYPDHDTSEIAEVLRRTIAITHFERRKRDTGVHQ